MDYYYQGKPVKLVPNQQFSTHWNFYLMEGGVRKIKSGRPGIDLVSSESVAVMVKPDEKTETTSEVVSTSININSATFTELHKGLPGLGRVAAKKIIGNRPEGGYKSLDHLIELNKASAENINWDAIGSSIVFE